MRFPLLGWAEVDVDELLSLELGMLEFIFVVEELSKSPEFEFVFGVELLPFPWFWLGEFWEDWLFWLEPLFDWDGGWEFWDCLLWSWD